MKKQFIIIFFCFSWLVAAIIIAVPAACIHKEDGVEMGRHNAADNESCSRGDQHVVNWISTTGETEYITPLNGADPGTICTCSPNSVYKDW